jgi:hypothetical protein
MSVGMAMKRFATSLPSDLFFNEMSYEQTCYDDLFPNDMVDGKPLDCFNELNVNGTELNVDEYETNENSDIYALFNNTPVNNFDFTNPPVEIAAVSCVNPQMICDVIPLYDARVHYSPLTFNHAHGVEVKVLHKTKLEALRLKTNGSADESEEESGDEDKHHTKKRRPVAKDICEDDNNDEAGNRKRVLFSHSQVTELVTLFDRQVDKRFSNEEIERIGRDVGLVPQQVRVFFQNRRARLKKKTRTSPVVVVNEMCFATPSESEDRDHNTRHKAHTMIVSSVNRSNNLVSRAYEGVPSVVVNVGESGVLTA